MVNSKRKEIVNPLSGPPPAGPYSRAVKYGDLVFLSGMSARHENGSAFRGSVEDETTNILENIKRILEQAGSGIDKVLKVTVILNDQNDWGRMNSVYKRYFARNPPARTTFQSNLDDAKVEMDVIAYS